MDPMLHAPRIEPLSDKAMASAYGGDYIPDVSNTGAASVWFEVETFPIYDTFGKVTGSEPRVMMCLRTSSDTQAVHKVPKRPGHEAKYPHQWARFIAEAEETPNGTTIEELPKVSARIRATLRALGIRTIEQAAEMNVDRAEKLLGRDAERVKLIAQAWVEREAGADYADAAGELAAYKARLEAIQREKEAIAAKLAATEQALSMTHAAGGAPRLGGAMPSERAVADDAAYDDLPGGDALGGGDVSPDFDDLTA